jgi:hypothetical protein
MLLYFYRILEFECLIIFIPQITFLAENCLLIKNDIEYAMPSGAQFSIYKQMIVTIQNIREQYTTTIKDGQSPKYLNLICMGGILSQVKYFPLYTD